MTPRTCQFRLSLLGGFLFLSLAAAASAQDKFDPTFQHWVWSTAHKIPDETTSEQSGYFSIVEGRDGKIYVGTAKYGANAYLVQFDPATQAMRVVMDAQREIGTTATGFAAQAKLHTRNNVGRSGRIYVGTKQGYPKEGEKRSDYPGGYPLVYDPATGKTRVYPIPIAQQGIISVTPDESRGVAYISTCSDERPIESTHFMILDLETGQYRDLLDCRHMYAFIVVDYQGRAYHPVLGGQIARYDPTSDRLERLAQTIDGQPPSEQSLLAHPESHPINWDISPDRKSLYAVAMSGNQLYAYDLTAAGDTLPGRSLGPLVAGAEKTDCRAMCVAPDGTVWAGVAATFADRGQFLHVVSYRPGDPGTANRGPVDHGPLAIANPDYATLVDQDNQPKPWHHGVYRLSDQTLLPRYVVMGICAAADGTVYLTTLYPFTLHAIRIPKIAGITTEYRHNSHADVLLTRLLKTDTLDGQGPTPPLQLASVFADQVPANDLSRPLAAEYGFRVAESVADALTLGTDRLAVDGVMLIAEHGKYPESNTGQFQFPKRRLFGEVAETFRRAGRVVPVFHDKHLADNWQDAKWIYDTARELKVPMLAGSSLPVLWRYPPADVPRGAKLREIVAVSYHRLDAYGFHALEMVQALAERRAGGETGVRAVQCLTGEAVWQAGEAGIFDRELLDQALGCLRERPLPAGKKVEELAREPVLFVIDYRDGLRANVLTLNHAVAEWAVAWRVAEDGQPANAHAVAGAAPGTVPASTAATLFWTQEERPFQHFGHLLRGIEQLMQTGRAPWPVERTLLTSGVLDALLISKRDGGQRLETPWLDVRYQSDWDWRQPPPPPAGRPITGP